MRSWAGVVVSVVVVVVGASGVSACGRRDDAARGEPTAEVVDAAAVSSEPVLDVAVGRDGVVTIEGDALLEDRAIGERLEAFHARAPRGRALVHTHPAALHGRTVRVLDLLKEAEIYKVSVDVTPQR